MWGRLGGLGPGVLPCDFKRTSSLSPSRAPPGLSAAPPGRTDGETHTHPHSLQAPHLV